MKKNIKQIVAVALILVMLVTFVPLHADAAITQNASLSLLTDSYTGGYGSFKLSTTARLFVVSVAAPSAQLQQTAELINAEFAAEGLPSATPLPLVWGDKQLVCEGDIILELVDGLAAEEYLLKVTKDNITVSAADTDGLLYGAHMAIKHFQVYNGMEIPACTVQDKPDTKERTLMLDCARKYWSVDWIKNLIRQMSWMGYNTLELHMTEDQGIRMNIWRDSKGNVVRDCNNNDFGWLPGYFPPYWASDAYNNQGVTSGVQDPNANKFYNRDELIDILNCAKEYHIEVIPGVDVPGHCDYFIYQWDNSGASGYFTYNYQGRTYSNRPSSIYISQSVLYPNDTYKSYGTLNVSDEYTKNMSMALIDAYADFFKKYGNSTKINIGCDEIRGCGTGTGYLSYDTFVSYVNELCAAMKAKGYSVRAYNDYLYRSTDYLDPNLEICYWKTTSYKNSNQQTITISPSAYIADGRTVYNCSANYCYYVLRYNKTHGDARSPSCWQWDFHHSTESRIFEGCAGGCGHSECKNNGGWNPSKLCEFSDSTVYTYSGEQLGGGYFLIWGDWAGWSTEEQVWNGLDADTKYNLIDRMWSNIIKMWNWDVDNSIDYHPNYWQLRNLYRLYPGFTAPSSAPSIPAASVMHRAADFTALQEQIAKEPSLSASEYTAESYAAYTAALAAAKEVYTNTAATQTEVDAARDNLATAFGALQLAIAKIVLKTTVGEEVKILAETEVEGGDIALELQGRRGYRFLRVEGNATYTPLFSGAEGGTIQGTVSKDMPIVIWYENMPQLDTLARLLSIDDAALLTANSGYAAEKQSAISFYNSIKDAPEAKTTQDIIDGYVNSLIAARTLATADAAETKIISLKTTTETVAQGKNAVLLVTTSPDVASVSIENVTLTDYEGKLTVTDSGDKVKIWYLSFVMETAREEAYSYTVTASGKTTVTDTFSIFCQ